MGNTFESIIFGITRNATDEEKIVIAKAVEDTPVSVFQILNKAFNARGLVISIGILKTPLDKPN